MLINMLEKFHFYTEAHYIFRHSSPFPSFFISIIYDINQIYICIIYVYIKVLLKNRKEVYFTSSALTYTV